jgi:aminoglycoside phosphotransferase (APT) family kinase protein
MYPHDFSAVLATLGFRSAQRLGMGVNSVVYQIDESRIVKISHRSGAQLPHLRDFLDQLTRGNFWFQTPQIFESGEIHGYSYTIERLLSGSPLREVFTNLTISQKHRCIQQLLNALDALHEIECPGVFGELLLEDRGVSDPSWVGFLRKKWLLAFQEYDAYLRLDFPAIYQVAELFQADISLLLHGSSPVVVHGDIFFPNILASPEGEITGIIDFSELTLAGDFMLDLVSLAIFAREDEGQTLINQLLDSRFGEEFARKKRLYGVYYAMRFCGCKPYDSDTYRWCVEEFRRYLDSA